MSNFTWQENKQQFISVADAKLEAKCFGPPPGEMPTIIMLHEGLGCVETWKSFPQALSEETGFGVFAYSRSGYGNSSPAILPRPMDYMTVEATEVLPAVLDTIGVKKGILLGHSDGATISAIYAGSVIDQRIRGLILMAPHFFGENESWEAIEVAKTAFEKEDLRARLARYHADPDNAFRGWNDAWLNPEFRDWNVSEVIDYLRVPVLAIQGEQDQYGTLAQIEEIENRIYSPLETSILKNCGHAPHLEKPEETLQSIRDFVAHLHRIEQEEVNLHISGSNTAA